jgi:hypothetical protein
MKHDLRQRKSRLLDYLSAGWLFSGVLQIVFNEISAAEISRMDTMDQLELLDAFKVSESDLVELDDGQEHECFGKMTRDGKTLYRFRANYCRIYFEVADNLVIVHRVLHKNTFSDFLFRSKMPVSEDEQLAESKHFWNLIDEGRNARRM